MGAVRELLGSGTILGMTIMPEAFPKTLLMIMAPGAFFITWYLHGYIQTLCSQQKTGLRKKNNRRGKNAINIIVISRNIRK